MIVLLPLDDRPCNTIFPRQLAAVAGWELAIAGGEEELLRPSSGTIVSLDRWVYGGLVESRAPALSSSDAVQRLSSLSRILEKIPEKAAPPSEGERHVITFAILMRQAPTAFTEAEEKEALVIKELSQLTDQSARENAPPSFKKRMAELKALLPKGRWKAYIETRKRNLSILRLALKLVKGSLVHHLLVGMDDHTRWGLHRNEQRILKEEARESNLGRHFQILPGADELGMVLTARTITRCLGIRPAFFPYYSHKEGKRAVLRYEGSTLERVVSSQVRAAGGRLVADASQADLLLCLHTPRAVQEEASCLNDGGLPPGTRQFLQRIRRWLDQGRLVLLADVACANGAHPAFLQEALRLIPFSHLAAFAAWNTTANTVGTVIAHGISRLVGAGGKISPSGHYGAPARSVQFGSAEAPGETFPPHQPLSELAHREFLFHRILDDGIYQALIRKEINEWVQEKGKSPLSLGRSTGEVEKRIREKLLPYAEKIARDHFGKRPGKFTVTLPWRRTFEIALFTTLE